MNLFSIKLIAVVAMAIDHLGIFVFNDNFYFRLIGRLAFPLFAWAIANGGVYTKNIYKYLLRIFILAIISQVPYQLLFSYYGVDNPGLNILFTFSLALVGLIVFKKSRNIVLRICSATALSLVALVINADYGPFGVLAVFVFYLFFDSKVKQILVYLLLVFAFFVTPIFVNKLASNFFEVNYLNFMEILSVISLLFIASYNNQIGYKMKYVLYIFYPLHLALLYVIKVLLVS